MKSIEVVAAVIKRNNQILATQRGYGDFKGGWEFPGGKIEQGEEEKDALVREINEELEVIVNVGEKLSVVEYDYPKFHLTMHCFLCEIQEGELVLKEHDAVKWLTKDTIYTVDWLPADVGLIEKIIPLI